MDSLHEGIGGEVCGLGARMDARLPLKPAGA